MDAVAESAYYLAEWYLPELTEQSVDDVVARLDAAAVSVSDEGTPVRLVVTLAVPTDEVLYGVFGADSSDIVSKTCLQAGVPHQRLSGDVGTRIRQSPVVTRAAPRPETRAHRPLKCQTAVPACASETLVYLASDAYASAARGHLVDVFWFADDDWGVVSSGW